MIAPPNIPTATNPRYSTTTPPTSGVRIENADATESLVPIALPRSSGSLVSAIKEVEATLVPDQPSPIMNNPKVITQYWSVTGTKTDPRATSITPAPRTGFLPNRSVNLPIGTENANIPKT